MIAEHRLDMKLVGADISFGGEKITFSFYAEERVDFRTLVADLAKALKTRIELRQVGAREEARMVGGLGPCGRGLCCTLFPPSDEPVSIRMAKEQNLPLNPAKISGLCGRLMCCLKYEQEQYVRFRKEAPAKGTPVSTPGGEGVVVGYNVLKDAITVRLEDGHSTDIKICSCQCQPDGCLLVVPEVGEPADPFGYPESLAAIETLAVAETAADEELAIVEAEVVLGENGEPVGVIVAETSRRSRSRRGRGRRGGRNRPHDAAGEGGVSGTAAEAGAAGGTGTAGGNARQHGQHPPRHPERHRGGTGSGQKGEAASGGSQNSGADGATAGAGTGPNPRPRRRRKTRRYNVDGSLMESSGGQAADGPAGQPSGGSPSQPSGGPGGGGGE